MVSLAVSSGKCYLLVLCLYSQNSQDFVLDIARAFPRVVFSESELEVMIWLAESLEASSLPSTRRLRYYRKQIQEVAGAQPTQHNGPLGSPFVTNQLSAIIAHVCF
jgi:hypothetical protein